MLQYKESDRIFIAYEGPFNISIIADLAKSIIKSIIASECTKKKLYRIFIELTQNVSFYSFNRILLSNGNHVGRGKVFINDINSGFQCTTFNKIMKEHAPVLIKNCEEINKLNITELREKKKQLRESGNYEDNSAHIGLIMISIYSGNPIDYEIITDPNSGDTYFKISASILINK